MNIYGTTNNCFRTAAHSTIRQKVERRKSLDLPGGLLLWQVTAKILLWSLPIVLGANLWCASSIDVQKAKSEKLVQALQQVRQENNELQVQVARLTSPVRVRIAAAEKQGLVDPTPEQIKQM